MNKDKGQKLIAIFVLFMVLFNFPILRIFNESHLWGGVPTLYLYIFGAWFIMILLIFLVVETKK